MQYLVIDGLCFEFVFLPGGTIQGCPLSIVWLLIALGGLFVLAKRMNLLACLIIRACADDMFTFFL